MKQNPYEDLDHFNDIFTDKQWKILKWIAIAVVFVMFVIAPCYDVLSTENTGWFLYDTTHDFVEGTFQYNCIKPEKCSVVDGFVMLAQTCFEVMFRAVFLPVQMCFYGSGCVSWYLQSKIIEDACPVFRYDIMDEIDRIKKLVVGLEMK